MINNILNEKSFTFSCQEQNTIRIFKVGYKETFDEQKFILNDYGEYELCQDITEYNKIKEFCDETSILFENKLSPIASFGGSTLTDSLRIDGIPSVKGDDIWKYVNPEREAQIEHLKKENERFRHLAGIARTL